MKRKYIAFFLALAIGAKLLGGLHCSTEGSKWILGQILPVKGAVAESLAPSLLRMGNSVFSAKLTKRRKQEPKEEPVSPAAWSPQVRNQTSYEINPAELVRQALPFLPLRDGKLPQVLIVHTHTSEGYQPEERSQDPEKNVIVIGEILTRALEKEGIGVIHDTTVHDADYNGSYGRSRETVEQILADHPSIQIVLDVHRDAATMEDGGSLAVTTDWEGKQVGQIMLVIGTDEGGLDHPDWKSNLSFALRLQREMDQQFPGLSRPLILRKERYNQDLAPGMVIVEVAASGNQPEEAKAGVKLFAKAMIKTLK